MRHSYELAHGFSQLSFSRLPRLVSSDARLRGEGPRAEMCAVSIVCVRSGGLTQSHTVWPSRVGVCASNEVQGKLRALINPDSPTRYCSLGRYSAVNVPNCFDS